MTGFLIALGLVTFVAWSYGAITAVAYATVFRRASDRLLLSSTWPYSVPAFVVVRTWLWIRRPKISLPKAQVRR